MALGALSESFNSIIPDAISCNTVDCKYLFSGAVFARGRTYHITWPTSGKSCNNFTRFNGDRSAPDVLIKVCAKNLDNPNRFTGITYSFIILKQKGHAPLQLVGCDDGGASGDPDSFSNN